MGGFSSDQSELYLGHGLVSKLHHKLHDYQREVSETVIKFIILSGQKLRSRILQFRVGSETCWFRKVRLVKINFGGSQSISHRLSLKTLDKF